jgi:8-oxo-dGTP pyrophosphatase MutT (NUDIX family)
MTPDHPTTRYVLAIAFDPGLRMTPLVLKNRPDFLAGLLNAPGGKVEPGDASGHEAASREFQEEAGPLVPAVRWHHVGDRSGARDDGSPFVIGVYAATLTAAEVAAVSTRTDEEVQWHDAHANLGALLSLGAPGLPMWLAAALDLLRRRGGRPLTVAVAEA